ncbi:triose-phosphate isomerase [Basfia succiniciproducens]|uniref:Triosephosphate isomerase n=1 Tax=Basfia succiniciproducens TaxID=653940 RepID=A0A1G5AQZ2_9PAST|nr:triose-phosphate isomerase [Basfia succiniciproducens]QIM69760.1 triose-phosphate isomerase [Basfia succiniciproducens]SCX80305.1 triosephosphate isomerase [Basfia succiniciproducens]
MKKYYFGTNLKMYKGIADTTRFLARLSELTHDIRANNDIELFVIPSYTAIQSAIQTTLATSHDNPIIIGAQNMNPNDNGQYTGDISPLMLKEIGTQLVMIGHSERRHKFGETDRQENEKVLSALKHDLTTLLCVGETLEQKNYNISDEVLRTQLKIGLSGINTNQLAKLRIAYEPVWAIGESGIPATADYANEKHAVIKQCLIELFGDAGKDIPVFYGGSVNAENSNELFGQQYIDGLFIGRSAWDAENFFKIIERIVNK